MAAFQPTEEDQRLFALLQNQEPLAPSGALDGPVIDPAFIAENTTRQPTIDEQMAAEFGLGAPVPQDLAIAPDVVSGSAAPLPIVAEPQTPVGPRRFAERTSGMGLEQQRLQDAKNSLDAANRAQGDADLAAIQQDALDTEALAALAAENEAREKEIDARANARTEEHIAEVRQLTEEAAVSVDPTRFWSDGGAFHKASGFIAAFLGGFTGQSASINQIIDGAINRDIESQKDSRKVSRQRIEDSKMLNSMGLAQDELESAQRERSFVSMKATLIGKMKQERAKLAEGAVSARVDLQIAQAEAGLAQDFNALGAVGFARNRQAELDEEKRRAQAEAEAHKRRQLAFRRSRARKADAEKAAAKEAAKLAAENAAKLAAGTIAPDTVFGLDSKSIGRHLGGEKEATKLRTAVGLWAPMQEELESYERNLIAKGPLYQGKGARTRLGSQALADLDAQHSRIFAIQGQMLSGAAIGEMEREEFKKFMPPPASITSNQDPARQIERLRKTLANQMSKAVENQVVRRGEDGRESPVKVKFFVETPDVDKEPERGSIESRASNYFEELKNRRAAISDDDNFQGDNDNEDRDQFFSMGSVANQTSLAREEVSAGFGKDGHRKLVRDAVTTMKSIRDRLDPRTQKAELLMVEDTLDNFERQLGDRDFRRSESLRHRAPPKKEDPGREPSGRKNDRDIALEIERRRTGR